jgi:phage/plasmid primase-like uncharacterized protein
MTDYTQDKISLSPYMRSLLLEEICKRMDIINYCKFFYHLTFKKCTKHTFTGDCPYCSGRRAFAINSTTGKSYCTACRQESDFLTLMSTKENIGLNSTLNRLSGYLKSAEEHKKAARAGGAL